MQKHGIPSDRITVFVVPEEVEEYTAVIPSDITIVPGQLGIVQQRAFIQEHYPPGAHIVMFDDDIREIDMSCSLQFADSCVDTFIRHAFDLCHHHSARIWGINPVSNQYFMKKEKHEVTTSLKFIVGCLFGIVNTHPPMHLPVAIQCAGQKEDVERTIKYFQEDGCVIRFNRITVHTTYYGKVGGLGNFKSRLQSNKDASHKLKDMYPDYGNVSTRKNGMTEFRLRRIST